jgi:hypothetical protein
VPFRPHSGIVIAVCPDPAYHAHWTDMLNGGSKFDKALDELLRYIIDNQGETAPDHLLQLAQEVVELRSSAPKSRMAQLIQWAFEHPENHDKRIPHILRVAGPAAMVGDLTRMYAFIGENRVVLEGAHTFLVDGHSECMDVAKRHRDRYKDDQSYLQKQWLNDGARTFAETHSALTRRDVSFHGHYTQFSQTGEVLAAEEVVTHQALALMN